MDIKKDEEWVEKLQHDQRDQDQRLVTDYRLA